MNCKPGDLAVIVKSALAQEGLMVRCVRLATPTEVAADHFTRYSAVWVLERPKMCLHGYLCALAYDAHLRPIRDPGDEAQDETLSWLPVPSTTKETA